MGIIQDASGTAAVVDGDKRLQVQSDYAAQISVEEGRAFAVNTATTANTLTLATVTTYNLLYLENTSTTRTLVIDKVVISAAATGTVLLLKRNMTLGVVANENALTPANLNFASATAVEGTFYSWDEVGTVGIGGLTVGTVVDSTLLDVGPTVLDQGVISLGLNDNLVVTVQNPTGGGIEATASVYFHYEINP